MRRYSVRLLVAVLTFTIGIVSPLIVKRILHPTRGFTDCVLFFDDVPPAVFDSPEDIREIYRVILRGRFTDPDRAAMPVVVSDSTSCPMYEDESQQLGHLQTQPFDRFVSEAMPTVEPRTLLDYLAKNKTSTPLQVSNLGVEYELVENKDLESFGPGEFWSNFYEKYPRANGIMFFSHIGFNPAHDQAFVYAARTCGGLCGAGSYVLLSKVNGKWQIVKDVGLWVS